MGGVYLLYSAYFLSLDFTAIYITVSIMIALLYLVFLGLFYKDAMRDNFAKLNRFLAGSGENMVECLVLKKKIVFFIWVGSSLFCLTNIIRYAGVNMIGDDFLRSKLSLGLQSLDFISFGIILWVCRPRKKWPDYFTLAVMD